MARNTNPSAAEVRADAQNDGSNAAQDAAEQADVIQPEAAKTDEKAAAPAGFGSFISEGGFTLDNPELAAAAAPIRARSGDQQAMDTVIEKANKHWRAAGTPTTWPALVAAKCVTTYFVEPDKSAGLKKLIDRAASFHGVRVRYGTSFVADAAMIKKYNLPAEYEGREVISFAAPDKRERASKTETSKTQPAQS